MKNNKKKIVCQCECHTEGWSGKTHHGYYVDNCNCKEGFIEDIEIESVSVKKKVYKLIKKSGFLKVFKMLSKEL